MAPVNLDFTAKGFREAVIFYNELRSLMYEELNIVFPGFRSGPITLEHAMEADGWAEVNHIESRTLWRWVDAFHYYTNKKRFKRFDLSIRNGVNLVGLAFGMPSQMKTKLKVNILEATPYREHKRNTRIFELISESAQIYADLLGADEVRIMRPVNEDVANHYCSFGYEYVEPAHKNIPVYCSLKLGD